MKKRIVFLLVLAICAMVLFPLCNLPASERDTPNKITLIWNKSYEGQTQQDVKRGLIWTLSWLGAELPKGSFEKALTTTDSTRFTINLDSVGFNETASRALRVICDSIRRSEEYTHYVGIDIGKFVMLTLGSTWHYYAITGAPKHLDDFRRQYRVDTSAYVFGVTTSTIAEGHRRIFFSRDTALFHCGFMAEEGNGRLTENNFSPTMYECFDVMPNGQLRFMIYDQYGKLAEGTPQIIGDAGKPTKCLWCHETNVQPLFIENVAVAGMLTNEEFLVMRDSVQSRLERYRLTLHTDMDWKQVRDHTLGELLYITYMEPTFMHMQNEWRMNERELKQRLDGILADEFREFDYIGLVYQREKINAREKIFVLEVPESARETGREVNYLE